MVELQVPVLSHRALLWGSMRDCFSVHSSLFGPDNPPQLKPQLFLVSTGLQNLASLWSESAEPPELLSPFNFMEKARRRWIIKKKNKWGGGIAQLVRAAGHQRHRYNH